MRAFATNLLPATSWTTWPGIATPATTSFFEWALNAGRHPDEDEIRDLERSSMRKRGWKDAMTTRLEQRKDESEASRDARTSRRFFSSSTRTRGDSDGVQVVDEHARGGGEGLF